MSDAVTIADITAWSSAGRCGGRGAPSRGRSLRAAPSPARQLGPRHSAGGSPGPVVLQQRPCRRIDAAARKQKLIGADACVPEPLGHLLGLHPVVNQVRTAVVLPGRQESRLHVRQRNRAESGARPPLHPIDDHNGGPWAMLPSGRRRERWHLSGCRRRGHDVPAAPAGLQHLCSSRCKRPRPTGWRGCRRLQPTRTDEAPVLGREHLLGRRLDIGWRPPGRRAQGCAGPPVGAVLGGGRPLVCRVARRPPALDITSNERPEPCRYWTGRRPISVGGWASPATGQLRPRWSATGGRRTPTPSPRFHGQGGAGCLAGYGPGSGHHQVGQGRRPRQVAADGVQDTPDCCSSAA